MNIVASNLVIRLRPLTARIQLSLHGVAVGPDFPKRWGKKIKDAKGDYGHCRGIASSRHVELPVSGEGLEIALALVAEYPVKYIAAHGLTDHACVAGTHFGASFRTYQRTPGGSSEEVITASAVHTFAQSLEAWADSPEAKARRYRNEQDRIRSEAGNARRQLAGLNAKHADELRGALEALTNLAVHLAPEHPALAKARAVLDAIVGEERQLQLTIAERESRIDARVA